MKATYEVNGIPLDDPEGRWNLLASSETPGSSGVAANLVDLPGVHGSRAVGAVKRALGRLILTVLVDGGGSHSRLRENWNALLNAVSSWRGNGSVPLVYDDGTVRMRTMAIMNASVTPELLNGGDVYEAVFSFILPDPFWEDDVESRLIMRSGVDRVWHALSGGSAPVVPTVNVKGSGIRSVVVRCLNCGESGVWRGSSDSVSWNGWRVNNDRQVSYGVEEIPQLCPDTEGNYRVRVDVSAQSVESISLTGRRRFQ